MSSLPMLHMGPLVLWAGVLALALGEAGADEGDVRRFEVMRLRSGIVVPYPLDNVFRGYARCRRGVPTHRALDIGGVGPDWGIGTPIRAIARSRVTRIGLPEEDPGLFGQRDVADGQVLRGHRTLPRHKDVPGYGRVRFFTTDYGRHRTGVLLVTQVLDGRLLGYTVRYMHMGAVHPALKVGSDVRAGQEIGLLGGTAVQIDAPHLHLSILDRRGRPVDPGPILGIGSTRFGCGKGRSRAAIASRARYGDRARKLMQRFARERARVPVVAAWPGGAGAHTHEDRFGRAQVRGHRVDLGEGGGGSVVHIRLRASAGRWRPRLEVRTGLDEPLFDGRRARGAGRDMGVQVHSAGRQPGAGLELTLRPGKQPLRLHISSFGRRPGPGAAYRLAVERAPAAAQAGRLGLEDEE